MNILYYFLDENEFNKICTCSSTKEIWDTLEIIYEYTNKMKESKISMLAHEYEIFKIESYEFMSNIFL